MLRQPSQSSSNRSVAGTIRGLTRDRGDAGAPMTHRPSGSASIVTICRDQ
jgi:hypothetical protein